MPREGLIQGFTSSYRGISDTVGVSLADLSDKEKAFNLESVGVVLGLDYDIPRWKVSIPEDKQARFMRSLIFAWQENGCVKKTLRQIVGKVEHYSLIIPDSRWYRKPLWEALDEDLKEDAFINFDEDTMMCIKYWIVQLDRMKETSIPDLREGFPAYYIEIATDAAGLNEKTCNWKGAGVILPNGNWVAFRWPKIFKWRRLGLKLSFLEGIAALAGVILAIIMFPGCAIKVREDNLGLCYIMGKKSSSCALTWTVAKAIRDLADARRVNVKLEKVGRRTNNMDMVADELSKGLISAARGRMTLDENMSELPGCFWDWLSDPCVDPGLGYKLALGNYAPS